MKKLSVAIPTRTSKIPTKSKSFKKSGFDKLRLRFMIFSPQSHIILGVLNIKSYLNNIHIELSGSFEKGSDTGSGTLSGHGLIS